MEDVKKQLDPRGFLRDLNAQNVPSFGEKAKEGFLLDALVHIESLLAEVERLSKQNDEFSSIIVEANTRENRLHAEIAALKAEVEAKRKGMGEWHEIAHMRRGEIADLKAALVRAREFLADGRSVWNGPIHRADAVLAGALEDLVEKGADEA